MPWSAINLLNLKRRPIYALSGGQKQRVAKSQGPLPATCHVLLLDEPTALLDPDSQNRSGDAGCGNLVKERGLTALWADSTDLVELDYCDRAFPAPIRGKVMERGRTQSD